MKKKTKKLLKSLEERVKRLEQERDERGTMKASEVPPTVPGQLTRSQEHDQTIRGGITIRDNPQA